MMLPPDFPPPDFAIGLLDHLPRRRLSQVKHAGQVDRDDAVPGLGVEIEKIEPVADPGQFQHDVEPAEFAHDSGNRRIDRRAVAYVESRRGGPPAGLTNAGGNSFGRRAVAVGAEHRGALARQPFGPGAADAASRPRDQRHLARDPPHACPPVMPPPSLALMRCRTEICCGTGRKVQHFRLAG